MDKIELLIVKNETNCRLPSHIFRDFIIGQKYNKIIVYNIWDTIRYLFKFI